MVKNYFLGLYILIVFVNCKTHEIEIKVNLIDLKVDSVLSLMTLDEKIGQMSQQSGLGELTGPVTEGEAYLQAIKQGKVGSMLNINGVEYTRQLQEINLRETRLGIPLLFGYDIIHGYKTIFPVPIADACSWDMEIIEKAARVAAMEGAAAGQHWTFAPMVDIARDPRWGRIMEGAGEDPYLGSLIAKARIKGFQGNDLSDPFTIAACAKHYAAYGAAEGGRDYNTADISYRTLVETYLPPFKACVDGGAATFMTSFNEVAGIPASGNGTLKSILKDDWKYQGMVVSDWNSIGELIVHGVAGNKDEAAILGMGAGIDMDMQGFVYSEVLLKLVKEGKINENQVDDAVRKILKLKFELGLFDDPFRYCNEQREQETLLSAENRAAARESAQKSIVLLKNNNELLPLNKQQLTIALIGPLANDKDAVLGNWRGAGESKDAVSVLEGLINMNNKNITVKYAKGCELESIANDKDLQEAKRTAQTADVIVLVLGEGAKMAGEARSRAEIGLPGVQPALLKELKKLGKPIVLILMNGRPLAIPHEVESADAVLETWQLGTEAGNAIADVLFGKYNPSGKLVASFPYSVGQIPVYYNHKNTGRPGTEGKEYNSKYFDIPIQPLFPFGFGLSYTQFVYSSLQLNKTVLLQGDSIEVSVHLRNAGKYDGEEVVQLYIHDKVASVTRPVKELKGFRKIFLKVNEEATVSFFITPEMLKFYDLNMNYTNEPGEFDVMVGTSSADYLETIFKLK